MPPKTTMTMTIRCTPILLSLSLMLGAGAAWAQNTPPPLAVPNEFTAGERARAAEVNANFNAVETAVNDNNSRIDTAQTTANAAQSDADTAQGTANTAASAAAAAQSAAVAAQESANETLADIATNHPAPAEGLEICPDGLTVADHDTGLLWERKVGTPNPNGQLDCGNLIIPVGDVPDPVGSISCSGENPQNDQPLTRRAFRDVNFAYSWSGGYTAGCFGTPLTTFSCITTPNSESCGPGRLFGHPELANHADLLRVLDLDLLDPLADQVSSAPSPNTQSADLTKAVPPCFAGHCNWRLPNILELQGFLTVDHLEVAGVDVGGVVSTPLGYTTWSSTQDLTSPVQCEPDQCQDTFSVPPQIDQSGCNTPADGLPLVQQNAFAVTCLPNVCFPQTLPKNEFHHARLVRAGSCTN
jgi:hypothetical protein